MTVLTYEKFKALRPVKRKEYLVELRKSQSDKDIRDFWNMSYSSYYYHIKSLGLAVADGNTNNKKVPDSDDAKSSAAKNTPKNGNGKREFIEAEYHVVEDEPPKQPPQQYLYPPPERSTVRVTTSLPMMNFPEMMGTVEQLRKRLNGILMVLEMDGEEATFKMKIEVFKNA